jgi:hypothetical protein
VRESINLKELVIWGVTGATPKKNRSKNGEELQTVVNINEV